MSREHRRSLVIERDDSGNRVFSLNNIKAWHAVLSFVLLVSSLLGGVAGIVKATVNSAIDARVHTAIVQARPEMVSAAEAAHNAIRHDLNLRIDGVEKDLAGATKRQDERAQEIKDELLYIRTRVDYLVARGSR